MSLPAGELYVPTDLQWSKHESEGQVVYSGTRDASIAVIVCDLARATEFEGDSAIQLIQEQLAAPLNLDLASVEQTDSLSAPYPWPESVELRLLLPPDKKRATAYLASKSGHTLIICTLGEDSPAQANVIAASFKPNLTVQRKSEVREGSSARIQSMLGTAATLLLIFAAAVPIGITLFVNRRKKLRHDPFRNALIGIGVGSVLAAGFDYTVLSRFSWASVGDHGEAFGGVLARAIFLGILALYFSRRWQQNLDAGEE